MAGIQRGGWSPAGDRLLVMAIFMTSCIMLSCAIAVSPLWLQ